MSTPVKDAVSGSAALATASATWTHVGGSGLSSPAVFVKVAGFNSGGSAYTHGCTFNGVSMSVISDAGGGTAWGDFVTWFGLLNPPGGNQTVVYTQTGSTSDIEYRSITFANVDQVSGWDGATQNIVGASSDPMTVTVNSRANDLVMDGFHYSDSTVTVTCNQTEIYQDNTNPNSARGGASTKAGGASVTLTWTFSNSPTGRVYRVIGFNIRQTADPVSKFTTPLTMRPGMFKPGNAR